MGLAASQARLLLLTAKNDKLELQAQQIEQERLLLAQEQETIAQEYSDATTNTVYVCTITDSDGDEYEANMNLENLAKSLAASESTSGTSVVIADSQGNPLVMATYNGSEVEYMVYNSETGEWEEDEDGTSSIVKQLNLTGSSTVLQNGLSNGSLQLLVQSTDETSNEENTQLGYDSDGDGEDDIWFVRKSTDSLSSVTSRYYTEDDAAAQAEYNVAMAKVNTMDTRLENRLNQIETQKTAVEQEMESVDSIISSNIERTFEYFS